jgi:hypothetical protein
MRSRRGYTPEELAAHADGIPEDIEDRLAAMKKASAPPGLQEEEREPSKPAPSPPVRSRPRQTGIDDRIQDDPPRHRLQAFRLADAEAAPDSPTRKTGGPGPRRGEKQLPNNTPKRRTSISLTADADARIEELRARWGTNLGVTIERVLREHSEAEADPGGNIDSQAISKVLHAAVDAVLQAARRRKT